MEYSNPKYQPKHDGNSLDREAAVFAERATEVFRETLAHPVDVVTYSEFRRALLPRLAKIAYGEDFDLEGWLSMVSHPTVELSVVDDHTGEEKYRLSSVYQQTDISCKDEEAEGISVYAQQLSMMKSTDSVGAHDRLMEMADARIDSTNPRTTIADGIRMIQRLNAVFRDHDLPELPDPSHLLEEYDARERGDFKPALSEEAKAVAAVPVEEEDEYDPL